jgi:hypothetical protein
MTTNLYNRKVGFMSSHLICIFGQAMDNVKTKFCYNHLLTLLHLELNYIIIIIIIIIILNYILVFESLPKFYLYGHFYI